MSATAKARQTEETGETLLDSDERERILRALDERAAHSRLTAGQRHFSPE
jgi:hypothetical protein